MACNLMALLRAALPKQCGRSRSITVRWHRMRWPDRLCAMPASGILIVNPEFRTRLGTGTLDDSYHRFPAKPAFRLYRTPEQFHSGEPEGSVASALLPIANLLRHLPAVPC